jgi:hypothetical protein
LGIKVENDIGPREFDRLDGNRALIKSSYSTALCIYYRVLSSRKR